MSEKKQQQKYSKQAFIEAATSSNEGILLQVLLADGKDYSKDEVQQLVADWKKKEVK